MHFEQESIPVQCIPPTSVTTIRCPCQGVGIPTLWVYLPPWGYLPPGYLPPWVYLPPTHRYLSPERDLGPEIPSLRWTDICENIIFPQLRWRAVTSNPLLSHWHSTHADMQSTIAISPASYFYPTF